MNIQNTDYENHIKTSHKSFHQNPRFTDVTLITEDFEAIQGHRIILSQASPMFDKLMMFNNPLVYLRGVKSEILKNILEYIYTGSVSLKEDQVNTFITLAQEFNISGMRSKDNCPELPSDEAPQNKDKESNNSSKSSTSTNALAQEFKISGMRSKDNCHELPSDAAPQNKDQESNNSSKSSTSTNAPMLKKLNKATEKPLSSEHNKKRFSCDQCDYSSLRHDHLKRHKDSSIHKSTFSCEECDYTTAIENHLKIHKNYIHRSDSDLKRESSDHLESNAELEKLLQEDDEENGVERNDEDAPDDVSDMENGVERSEDDLATDDVSMSQLQDNLNKQLETIYC